MDSKMVTLPISQMKGMIKRRFMARIKEGIKTRPVSVIGHKGVGKSDAVRQAAEELSKELGKPVECRTTNLQFCEPPDFLGLPFVTGDRGEEVTRHARPELLPQDGYGIWFLDEANRCSRDNRSGLLTLIQDGEVNGHKLGKNWIIVLAMNPTEADGVAYEVQEFDAALTDRICPVEFKGDVKEFINYLTTKYGPENPVVRWVTSEPDVVDFKGKLRTSPRGLEYLIKALQAEGGIEASTSFETISAEIGPEAASVFRKFLAAQEVLTAEEIVEHYGPKVVEKVKWFESQGRNDVLNTVANGVTMLIVTKMKTLKKGSKDFNKMITNVATYLMDAPADTRVSFFMACGENLTEGDAFGVVTKALWQSNADLCAFLKDLQKKRKEQADAAAAEAAKNQKK
jgi:hypothetical protein